MILSVNLADNTGNQWVTCFQESAECVLGVSAEELGNMKESVSTFKDLSTLHFLFLFNPLPKSWLQVLVMNASRMNVKTFLVLLNQEADKTRIHPWN